MTFAGWIMSATRPFGPADRRRVWTDGPTLDGGACRSQASREPRSNKLHNPAPDNRSSLLHKKSPALPGS